MLRKPNTIYVCPHDDLVQLVIESHWARAWCEEDGAKLYHHHDSVIAIAPWKLSKGRDCLLTNFSQENESQRAWQKKGSYWVCDDCLKHIIDAQGSRSLYLLGTSCVWIKESIILLPTIINGMNFNIYYWIFFINQYNKIWKIDKSCVNLSINEQNVIIFPFLFL